MTWLKDAKSFDVYRNLKSAKQRVRRAELQAAEAWAGYEATGTTRDLWRWDHYADKAQASLAGVSRAEALIRLANP